MNGESKDRRNGAGDSPAGKRIEIKVGGLDGTNGPTEASPDPAPERQAGEGVDGEALVEQGMVELHHSEYEELKVLARERDEFYRRLQRAVADYQNLQKRVGKFRDAARESVLRTLGEAILPVADSLALALEAARKTEGGESIVEGLKLVEKEFYGALARFDIRPVDAEGQLFDPHFHEALFQMPTDEVAPNTVLQELKRGFVMGNIVLRPSQVVVAGPPAKQ